MPAPTPDDPTPAASGPTTAAARRTFRPAFARRLPTGVHQGVLLVALLLVAGGCQPTSPAPVTSKEATLNQLEVIDRPAPDPSYRRAAFGSAWADVDGDGCNTRDQTLFATVDRSHPYQVRWQGRCRTDMVAGTWVDLYTRREMVFTNLKDPAQAQRLPLDHVLSLAGSWRYGTRNWTNKQRRRFANDPLNLTPTTAATNRDKSDQDPATWTPPPAGRCDYATRYIAVKAHYHLPVDEAEKAALRSLLHTCPG